MREIDPTIPDLAKAFERARQESQTDPLGSLPLIQQALRLSHAVGLQCIKNRCFALLGLTLGRVGRTDHAELAFDLAYRSSCGCCRAFADRHFSYFLASLPGRASDALFHAARGVEHAAPADKGRALLAQGVVFYNTGNAKSATSTLLKAIDVIPVSSTDHSIALANLCTALSSSDNPKQLRQASAILERIEARFKGVKRASLERAQLSWATGQVLGRSVRVAELKSWERRRTLACARKHLIDAIRRFKILRLNLYIAAVHSDLAIINAMLDPLRISETLNALQPRGQQSGKAFDLSEAHATAIHAADGLMSPERSARIWSSLKKLRQATVKAGASPPLLIYSAPTS